jgi:2-polyprenyl-3-methyl-5-hydroxy-6-metoxy-1,4-benzoquinol methylase
MKTSLINSFIEKEISKLFHHIPQNQKEIIDLIQSNIDDGSYNFEQSYCPCGSKKYEVLCSTDRFRLPIPYVICHNCGLIRQERTFSERSLSHFYSHYFRRLYRRDRRVDRNFFYRQYRRALIKVSFLKRHINATSGLKALDYGCSAGGFTMALNQGGFSTIGCDYDSNYIKFGRDTFDLDLRDGGLSTVSKEKFDLVVLHHVLEHMRDPLTFLRSLKTHLKSTGYLYVAVPGLRTFFGRAGNPLAEQFHLAHIFLFTPENLILLARQIGLQPIFINSDIEAVFKVGKGQFDIGSSTYLKNINFINRWYKNPFYRYHCLITKAFPYRIRYLIRKKIVKEQARTVLSS